MLGPSLPGRETNGTSMKIQTSEHQSVSLLFSGTFIAAFGKGYGGLLDGSCLCNESAGLITLARITELKVLAVRLKKANPLFLFFPLSDVFPEIVQRPKRAPGLTP